MSASRTNLLATGLVWIAAAGIACSGFVAPAPCQCQHQQVAAAPACPHCKVAKPEDSGCCGAGCGDRDDCSCPCCHGFPTRRPLTTAVAPAKPRLDDHDQLFSLPVLAMLSPAVPADATRGWRDFERMAIRAPALDRLCRWII